MAISMDTYLNFTETVDVEIDGNTLINPGTAEVVRITAISDPTNSYLAGIKEDSGIDSSLKARLLLVFNCTASAIHVAHETDPAAQVALPRQQIRMESGTYDLQVNAGKLFLYAFEKWRIVGA